jgi:hypothetical protein
MEIKPDHSAPLLEVITRVTQCDAASLQALDQMIPPSAKESTPHRMSRTSLATALRREFQAFDVSLHRGEIMAAARRRARKSAAKKGGGRRSKAARSASARKGARTRARNKAAKAAARKKRR